MADESQTLFQEIDEALRTDKMAALWDEHRSTIIGCAVAIVLGTAASVIWRNFTDHRASAATAQLIQAQELADAGKNDEAAAAFKAVADSYAKESTLARIKQAQALLAAEKKDKATEVLAAGGGDKGLSGLLLLQAAARGSAGEAALRAQAGPGQSFSPAVKEQPALRYIEQGKNKEAGELLAQLENDPQAPATLRERAGKILHVIQE